MELARRSALTVLLISLLAAGWYGWSQWSRHNPVFTVTRGAEGADHANRRCAKRGQVARLAFDERPDLVTYQCVKPR